MLLCGIWHGVEITVFEADDLGQEIVVRVTVERCDGARRPKPCIDTLQAAALCVFWDLKVALERRDLVKKHVLRKVGHLQAGRVNTLLAALVARNNVPAVASKTAVILVERCRREIFVCMSITSRLV